MLNNYLGRRTVKKPGTVRFAEPFLHIWLCILSI